MGTIAEELKKKFEVLKNEEMYFVRDESIFKHFAMYPDNTDKAEVVTKVNTLNHKEIKENLATDYMADHIISLNIDPRLKANDLSVVEDIANLTINDKKLHLLNFASMYCNYHKPDVYPIYSEQHLDFAKEYIKELNLNIDPEKLTQYEVNKALQDDIINRVLGDRKVNYFETRKFGWAYLDKFIEQYRSNSIK